MAKCIDCGTPFGCGCQLINGRCSACNYAYEQSLIAPKLPSQPVQNQNVTSPPK